MPVLDVRFIGSPSEDVRDGLARRIADAAAAVFRSGPMQTWVAVEYLDGRDYAENGGGPPNGTLPVIVSVLLADLPEEEVLARQAARLAEVVGIACGRPAANIHIVYQPAGRGRVAFGGRLLARPDTLARERTTMDPVVHFEMPYEDAGRLSRFYETAFGWQMQRLSGEMGGYVLAMTTESDERGPRTPGAINGGFFAKQPEWPASTSVVIQVTDLGAAMNAVRSAGGRVEGEPLEIPGIGNYVALVDTVGNRVGMLQPVAGG